jgi:hypothetical protein
LAWVADGQQRADGRPFASYSAETRAVLAHNFFLSPTKLEPEAVLLAILASLSPDAPLL